MGRSSVARAEAAAVPVKQSGKARERHLAGEIPELDRLIHERIRLGIISALAVNDSLTFGDLKRLLRTTDGNLSVHARKLEEGGYLTCKKFFEGRIPRTEYRLAAAGRRALDQYLQDMEEVIRLARA
ncbi:MAG: transcriptional regulator [Acidobacteria bacterium]|nr:MAG: transcriptional regulator [Acidobacteriota bacterium]